MQKRVRTVEAQKVRRNFKARVRFSDTIKDGMVWWIEWAKMIILFAVVVVFDFFSGLRVELIYPFLLVLRAGYAAMQKNHSIISTLANQNTAKFSVLFVCVTATSDLVCYLFIPSHWLIFLASCYVWLSLLWASYGGFLRALSAIRGEAATTAPVLFGAFFVICFELFCRLRCDILVVSIGERFLYTADGQACEFVRGMGGPLPRTLNAFFAAHCIGYPLILISFSLRYYAREWLIRRREVDVARRNESYYKLLTESLPAVYEGPRDYSIRTPILEEECDLLGSSGLDLQPMLMAPPYCNGNSTSSSSSSRKSSKTSNGLRNRQGSRNKGGGGSQHSTPPQKNGGCGRRIDEEDDDSDGSDEWQQNSSGTPAGSVSFLRLVWSLLRWTGSILPSGVPDEDDVTEHGDEYKKGVRNGDVNKGRSVVARKGRVREKSNKDKVITAHAIEREKVCPQPVTMNGGGPPKSETRESSRDTSVSNSTTTTAASRISMTLELERLKSEVQQLRNAEQDAKLQLAAARNTETILRNENNNLKANLERADQKIRAVEKLRESDRSNMSQLEKKYAELLNKKNDVERELMAERKARKEDGGKRTENTEQQRERERELESTVDKLRSEAVLQAERSQQLQEEVNDLRKYKENNDTDVSGKDMEIKHLKERVAALEESLQSENKLKQDLFRALGDARTHNAHLEERLRTSHESALSVAVHHPVSVSERTSPSQQIPNNSPPSYNMALQHPRCDPHMGPSYVYAALQQHHSSPTGEHLLFDTQAASPRSPCLSPHDPLVAARMGKFGAPANPTRIN